MAIDFQPCFLQAGQHADAVFHLASLDALLQVLSDKRLRIGGGLETGPQGKGLDLGLMVVDLRGPSSGRIHRIRPAFLKIPCVSQSVVRILMSRWARVISLSIAKVQPWNYKMQLNVSAVFMSHPQNIEFVGAHAGEDQPLKILHHGPLLRLAWRVVALEGNHAAGVFPPVLAAVD